MEEGLRNENPPPPAARARCAALCHVEHTVLAELLGLPAGAYIDAVQADHAIPGLITVRICGAGWPVVPGEPLQWVRPTIHVRRNGAGGVIERRIDWGLPA